MTMVELGRLDWPRAELRIGDDNYGRIHLWGDGTSYNAENVNGDLIGSLTIRVDEEGNRTVERIDSKTWEMTGEDGTVWRLAKAGCNCGG